MKTPQLPFPKLSQALGIPNEVWLKREDQHKYESHKGRSIPLMIDEYRKQGLNNFIVSSSGNAALAAALYIQTKNKSKPMELRLRIMVGERINPAKLKHLQAIAQADPAITIEQVSNPKQQAFQLEKDGHGKWLRQSTDDLALAGYAELAQELAKIPHLSAIFVPTSSGTTAQGLFQGFQQLGINPQIHIVQTTNCHPIVDGVIARSDKGATKQPPSLAPADSKGIATSASGGLAMTQRSLATAIVDRIAHRKETVLEALKNSHGGGWIATNEEITEAIKIVKQTAGVAISPNSALSIVGLMQATKAGWKLWEGPVVCLVTGK